jgi:hypothetical protein
MRSPLPKTGTWDCARQTSDQAAGNPVPVVSYSFAGMQPNLPREWTEVGPENFCFQSGVANPHIAALLITIQSSGTMPEIRSRDLRPTMRVTRPTVDRDVAPRGAFAGPFLEPPPGLKRTP